MDQVLETLFGELSMRIEKCQEKNPDIDMSDIIRYTILIKSYIDGFNNKPLQNELDTSRDNHSLPYLSYEELCKLTRPPRVTPKGHLGPAYSMVHYAEDSDNRRARIVDDVIRDAKELEKNKDKPFF